MREWRKNTLYPLVTGLILFLLVPPAFAKDLVRDTGGQNTVCLSCHSGGSRILAHRELKIKNLDLASCLQCHEPHSSAGSGEGANSLRRPAQGSCTACHYQYSPLRLAVLRRGGETVHNPVTRGACTDCHSEHAEGEQPTLLVAGGDLCLSCHQSAGRKLQDKYRHIPFAGKQCTSCHEPHLARNKGLLILPTGRLCESCHLDRERAAGASYPHQPYARGLCASCHDPHGSNNTRQLMEAPGRLCFSCHADRRKEMQKAVSHPPFAAGECYRCHNPHAGQGEKLIRARTTEELCYGCHREMREEFALPSHHPVGSRLECSSCHTPHAGDFRKLQIFEGNRLCFSCHQAKAWYYERIGHSRMEGEAFMGSCSNCHLPHGSAFKPLLLGLEMPLCLSCHARMGRSACTHPVGEGYRDPARGDELTCTSTCHDPHGTAFQNNVTKKGDGLCLTCHDLGKR